MSIYLTYYLVSRLLLAFALSSMALVLTANFPAVMNWQIG